MRLFDTTFIIDLVNSDEGAVELAEKVDKESSLAAVSVITVHEYLFGVHHTYGGGERFSEKLAVAQDELARFEVLPLTKEVVEISSEMHARLAKAGRQIGINDIYIGATALKYGLTMVSRNGTHFERIQGITLEAY